MDDCLAEAASLGYHELQLLSNLVVVPDSSLNLCQPQGTLEHRLMIVLVLSDLDGLDHTFECTVHLAKSVTQGALGESVAIDSINSHIRQVLPQLLLDVELSQVMIVEPM